MKRQRSVRAKPGPKPSLLLETLRCEPGLLWPVLRCLCDDAESLLALYQALRTTPQWPTMARHFDTAWFLAYKALWPSELVHAWELDWMSANAASWWSENINNLLFKIEGIGGVLLDSTFPRIVNLGLSARQLYASKPHRPSYYMQLAYNVEPCSSALRPARLVSQWRLSTLKLRRLVWALLRRVTQCIGAYWKQNAWSTLLVQFDHNENEQDGAQRIVYDTRGLWMHSVVFTHLNGALMAPCIAWDSAVLQKLLEPPPDHYRHEMIGTALPLHQVQWWRDTVAELVTQIDAEVPGNDEQTLLEALSVPEEEEQGVVGPQWSWVWDTGVSQGFFKRLYNASPTELARAH